MVEMSVFCDFCGKRMPGDSNNNVKLFHTKEINTRKLFPHLCENCANKLDEAVRFGTSQLVTKSELAARMAKINAERRERLGMKG